jgi:lysine 2,3-aminomutase
MKTPKYLTQLTQITQLSDEQKVRLDVVSQRFAFRSNEYYQELIDWDDPMDPIRRVVIPIEGELEQWGELDVSDEGLYTKVKGLEHKYKETALLLVNNVCGGYCRFCFRKRLFMDDNDEVVNDITEGLNYIREHQEITNVLLTGGDPLVMSTNKLENIIRSIREIDHVRIIRIGTKMPAFSPARILNDPSLLEMIERYTSNTKKIYIMLHFNHRRELADASIEGINRLQKAGAITVNQTPLIRGINDDPLVLSKLFDEMSFIGVPSYYVFQCRPTLGNKSYSVPLEEAYEIFVGSLARGSGLAKRARFVMSHTTGKIEVVGMTGEHIFFRYHQSVDPENNSSFMSFKRNPNAHWFDDYEETRRISGKAKDLIAEATCDSCAF